MNHGEFDRDWDGWDLLTPQSQLMDVMTDPYRGVALVELDGARPQALIAEINERVQAWADPVDTEPLYMKYPRIEYPPGSRPNIRRDGRTDPTNQLLEGLDEPMAQIRDASNAVAAELLAERNSRRQFVLEIAVRKRQEFKEGHIDQGGPPLTVWLGATMLGINVEYGGRMHYIARIPEGHGLMWRAKDGPPYAEEDPSWPPTAHYVRFRRTRPRVALLAG